MSEHPPKRWLVCGGTGAVGRCLLARLQAAGIAVDAISRAPPPSADATDVRWIRTGLESAAAPAELSGGAGPAVIASAGPLDAFADWLQRSPAPAGTRVLALSSLSADWKLHSPQPAERDLAQRLLHSEQALFDACARAGSGLTVLRCGLIYGTGQDRSLSPLLALARRWRVLPWPRAARGLRQPVHADDLAAALLKVASRGDLAQTLLRLPGPDELSFQQMLQRSLARMSPSPRLMRLPSPGLELLAARLSPRQGRLGRLAATVLRLYQDQCVPASDWHRLGLWPRPFPGSTEPSADQFQN